jgi:Uma2 family endonuclease
MATMTDTRTDQDSPPPPIPPLQNGDRLTRDEFERRYAAMPFLKKAELIEGIVYIPTSFSMSPSLGDSSLASPVSFPNHANPHFNLVNWLGRFCEGSPGVAGGDNGSLRLDLDNMPQPDAFLIVLPACGGQARISADGYVEGAPELVAEVAASSVSYDLHVKLNVYRRNGVREYVVWRVGDRTIDWFALERGQYTPLGVSAEGLYMSQVFPGLWLDPDALIRGDLAAVSQVVQQGLATPEHAAFVARMQQAAARAEGTRP